MSNFSRFIYRQRVALRGHLLNPLWQSRKDRRDAFCYVVRSEISRYFSRHLPMIGKTVPDSLPVAEEAPERIFSIWLQGEEQAPPIVRACFRSIRKNCSSQLVVLNSKTIFDWIQLPDYVIDKWKAGSMISAHFADICRLALLYRHGGLWMDATAFAAHSVPEWIWKEDFFVYMAGHSVGGYYSYIQNCFIRARRGNYLAKAWLDAVLAYWAEENKSIDYFQHQLLFKYVVETDAEAASQFARMTKVDQDPTHMIWYGYGKLPFDAGTFESICAKSAFQKTEYKSEMAQNPLPGSYADHMINMYL